MNLLARILQKKVACEAVSECFVPYTNHGFD